MKRDCGQGELIPIKWVVVSCQGRSDHEIEQSFPTLELALINYKEQLEYVLATPCSDVRLYAKDKQGYMNCMKMAIHSLSEITYTDRLSEL